MDFNAIKDNFKTHLAKTEESLKREFTTIRTGRANPALLDGVRVEAYGSLVPLNQVGNVNVPEPRMLSVSVWDKSLIRKVEQAIQEAGLGLNPMNDGTIIRLPIPPLSEERRLELVKLAGRYTEDARVAARNVRREAMDALKELKSKNVISEDDQKRHEKELQDIMDACMKSFDDHLKVKETEIKQV
ncbi:MAG: ribosome recycling factor [Alphaproteobacteria bacterium]|nr:ribosome recycling factor [Alphaproteobacteria bacterium]